MPGHGTFYVHALIFDGSNSFRSCKEYLEKEESIMGSAARLKLNVEFVDETDDLLQRISDSIAHTDSSRMIALSEKLATHHENGGWRPTPLVRKVRELSSAIQPISAGSLLF